jgi:fatty acid desaturase
MGDAFPPLEEVRKNLKIRWYRSPLGNAALKDLTERSDLRGGLQAFGHLFLFLATASLAFWMWSSQVWIGFAAALFLHGTVSSFLLGVAPHELAHGTVFRAKWLNRVFLNIFSTISLWNYFDYGMSHTHHHRYTLHPEGDREVFLPLEPKADFLFILQLFTVRIYSPSGRTFTRGGLISTLLETAATAFGIRVKPKSTRQEWIASLREDQPEVARQSIRWSRWLLLFHGALLLASIVSGYWILSLLITVAPFTATWASYATGLAQHCGMKDNSPDFRENCRSIRLGPVLEFLYWRMNWHVEHHMYAAVPCYNLKRLHRLVSGDMPPPKTLLGAWKEMRDTWKRQQLDPSYRLDRGLPGSAGASGGKADELASSIGDLAPKGLE